MHAEDQVLAREGAPIELCGEISPTLASFGEALVDARVLANPLELSYIGAGDSACAKRQPHELRDLAAMPGFAEWVDWVTRWTAEFARMTESGAVRLRMSHSRQPTCPRFHVDAVTWRLIATLVGPGTQWLRSADVLRASDGRVDQSVLPELIQQMEMNSIGLFPGTKSNPSAAAGVVHRSPPDHVDRVVLTLDVAA